MALNITWTATGQESFDSIYEYIESKFGESSAIEFLKKSFSVLDYISIFPDIGSDEDKKKGIKGFVLSSQTSIFYRIENENLVVLHFYDNRRNPRLRDEFY